MFQTSMLQRHGSFTHSLLHQNWTPLRPKEYTTNISKYIQDISKTPKINTKYQAAAGPARPGPSPGPRGPAPVRARPRAWPGPGRAGGHLVFCIYLGYLGCILDTFGYILGTFSVRRTGVLFWWSSKWETAIYIYIYIYICTYVHIDMYRHMHLSLSLYIYIYICDTHPV